MNSSLNIAGKIDSLTVAMFRTVNDATSELAIPYVVVGATARDMVMHYGHGADIERATQDVDFAIEVPNWAAFHTLKAKLCEKGFKSTASGQRLFGPSGTKLDIVPFGEIASEDDAISWHASICTPSGATCQKHRRS